MFEHHLDGRPPERLSREVENFTAPVPTPDGKTLLVTVIREGVPLIVRIELETKKEQEIVSEGTAVGVLANGTELAYLMIDEVWVKSIAGGPSRPVFPMLQGELFAAVAADDIAHFAIATSSGIEAWRASLQTGVVEKEDRGAFQLPAPVGGWRAIASLGPPSTKPRTIGESRLELVPPNGWTGSVPRPIVDISFPIVWDPSGQAILFRRSDEIRRMVVPTGEDQLVVRAAGLATFVIGPDGKTLYTIESIIRNHAMRMTNFDRRPRPSAP